MKSLVFLFVSLVLSPSPSYSQNKKILEIEIPEGTAIDYVVKSKKAILMIAFFNETESKIMLNKKLGKEWKYTFNTTKKDQILRLEAWSNFNNSSGVLCQIFINGKVLKQGEGEFVSLKVNQEISF